MQQRYAATLQVFVVVGLTLLIVFYLLYITGLVRSALEPRQVTELWHLDSETLLEASGRDPGWAWVRSIGRGDMLSYASMVLLACGTIINLVLILPWFLRRRDWWYVGIVSAQIVLLIFAASGLFSL